MPSTQDRIQYLEAVASAARELLTFLGENSGTTDDWPIGIVARGEDSCERFVRLLNNLRDTLDSL